MPIDEPSTSTSPAPSITKKEKAKKKPPEVKKKKEDVTEKKEVAVSASKVAHSGPIIPEDVPIEVDDRLKVYYRGSSDYEAKVLEISFQDGKSIYRVHYKGWNARYDEWIHRESIAENLTKDEPKKKTGSNASKSSTPSTSSNLTTPTSKNATRSRNRADTTASSRSTTPLSNTSGKGNAVQKRITRGAPASKSSRRPSMNDDNESSESDEPIKKPIDKKDDAKMSGIQKSASSDLNEIRSELKNIKDIKSGEKGQETGADVGSKSDDEKSTKSSIKSGKSPFDVKAKLKTLQRDSSRSSFHSSDTDSSHSVPSDVPNSSKSAYTSDNESNGPEKAPQIVVAKVDAKKSSFRFDDDSSDVKNPAMTSFFEKVGEKPEAKADAAIFTSKKPNIFQEKKLVQQRALTASDTKVGRFGQLEKSLTKEAAKTKVKDVKVEDNPAESDVYEFKDTEEFSDAKVHPASAKKQEPPNEGLTKKQQLAQQRKQARALQKEALEGGQMEDIESMIKTSIVQSNKKRKKSPSKEEKSMIVARSPAIQPIAQQSVASYSGWTPVTDHYAPKPGPQMTPKSTKHESTFDVLRKSPSFNMHVVDDFPIAKPQPFASGSRGPVKSLFGSSQDLDSHELLKPIMVPTSEDEKPELDAKLEAFKKILEPSFEELPKNEKTGSIVDKLLKSMNKKEAEASHQVDVVAKKEEAFAKTELKVDPYAFKVSPMASSVVKKPLLVSPETKVEDKAKGNVELQGTIQKLESAIHRSATPLGGLELGSPDSSSHFAVVKKQADDSDTDSDPRLVIEDELEPMDKKKPMGVLESIMMQEDVPYKHNNPSGAKEEAEKKSESGEQQSETMSLLLCEETIPGSPAPVPVKDPLSEVGRSPSSSGGFVHPPTMPSQSSNYMKYPGSITTARLHQQYQSSASHSTNLKQIPMDIDTDVNEAATGDILRDKLKSERGSATSSGNNTNNNSDNSPRDSNDDQSESEKNSERVL